MEGAAAAGTSGTAAAGSPAAPASTSTDANDPLALAQYQEVMKPLQVGGWVDEVVAAVAVAVGSKPLPSPLVAFEAWGMRAHACMHACVQGHLRIGLRMKAQNGVSPATSSLFTSVRCPAAPLRSALSQCDCARQAACCAGVVVAAAQVDMVSGLTVGAFHYKSALSGEGAAPRTRAVRLAKEVASLESLLPLHPSSSIFVRVDEARVQVCMAGHMHALARPRTRRIHACIYAHVNPCVNKARLQVQPTPRHDTAATRNTSFGMQPPAADSAKPYRGGCSTHTLCACRLHPHGMHL